MEITPADREAVRCEHGTRWPHQCDECDDEAIKPHNLIAKIEAQAALIAELRETIVTLWHNSQDQRPLHECLGLTWEEYGQWLHGKGQS